MWYIYIYFNTELLYILPYKTIISYIIIYMHCLYLHTFCIIFKFSMLSLTIINCDARVCLHFARQIILSYHWNICIALHCIFYILQNMIPRISIFIALTISHHSFTTMAALYIYILIKVICIIDVITATFANNSLHFYREADFFPDAKLHASES